MNSARSPHNRGMSIICAMRSLRTLWLLPLALTLPGALFAARDRALALLQELTGAVISSASAVVGGPPAERGPILLRTAMDAGHAGSPGRFDRLDDVARAYAFAIACAERRIGAAP